MASSGNSFRIASDVETDFNRSGAFKIWGVRRDARYLTKDMALADPIRMIEEGLLNYFASLSVDDRESGQSMFMVTTVARDGDADVPKRFWCSLSGVCLHPLYFDVSLSDSFDIASQANPLELPCMLQLNATETRVGNGTRPCICTVKGDEFLPVLAAEQKPLDLYSVADYTIPRDDEYGDDLLFTVVERLEWIGHLWHDAMKAPLMSGARSRQPAGAKLATGDPLNPVLAAMRRARDAARAAKGKGRGSGRGRGRGGRGRGPGRRGRGAGRNAGAGAAATAGQDRTRSGGMGGGLAGPPEIHF